MQIKSRNIKKGIAIFTTITVIVITGILIFTIDKRTLNALKSFNPFSLLLLFLFWASLQTIDGLRFQLIVNNKNEKKITVIDGISIILMGYFLAIVTPFQFGGLPVQLFFMNKKKISTGKSIAFLTIRGILIWIPVILISTIFLFIFGIKVKAFLPLFAVYLLSIIFIILSIIFVVLSPEFMRKFILKITVKNRKNIIGRFLRWFLKESKEFSFAFRLLFKKKKSTLFLIFFISLIYLFMLFSFVYIILFSMNIRTNFIKAVGLQFVSTTFSLWSPSPGGAGIVEVSSVLFYSLICPKYLLGILIVTWRFFTMYLPGIAGGFFLAKETKQIKK